MATNSQVLLGLYAAMYVRAPDKTGYNYWMSAFTAAAPNTLTPRAAATGFSTRVEWVTTYPATLTTTAYVDAIYQNVLGIAGDPTGRKFWADNITAGKYSRTDFVADFIAGVIDYDSAKDSTSTQTQKDAAVAAQTTLKNKITFSEAWLNSSLSNNPTQTGTDASGKYIATDDKSVALLAGVKDAASLTTQLTALSTAEAAAAIAGVALKLTTGADVFAALSNKNDSISGTDGTLNSGDIIIDNVTTDADILTASGVTADTKPTITNIETLNLSNSASTGLDMSVVTATKTLNLSTTAANGSASATNAKTASVTSIIAGTNISNLTVTTDSQGTGGEVKIDAGTAKNITLAGGDGNDILALTIANDVTLKSGSAAKIDALKLIVNKTTATVVTLDSAQDLLIPAGKLEIAATGDVSLNASLSALDSKTVVKGAGKLAVTLAPTTVAAVDATLGYDLKNVPSTTFTVGADLGKVTVAVADATTFGITATQTALKIANAVSATIVNSVATQTEFSSATVKTLTINSRAAEGNVSFANLDFGVADAKVSFIGGATTAQNIQVTRGNLSNVDASKLVGSLDYTQTASGKFSVAGSAGADRITIAAASSGITASLDAGDDTFILSGVALDANTVVSVDGGTGNDTLKLTAGTDVSAASGLKLLSIESIGFDNTGGDITFSAPQLLGQSSYSVTGSGGADNLIIKGLSSSVVMNAASLNLDAAVELVTLDGSAGVVAQTITGVLGSGGVLPKHVIKGGAANDSMTGGMNNDTLEGGAGNDTLTGGDGNDSLVGGEGDDSLDGGIGDDTLVGGAGNDTLNGGDGNDTFLFAQAITGKVTINGGAGTNSLRLGGGIDLSTMPLANIQVIEFDSGGDLTISTSALPVGQTYSIRGSAGTNDNFIIKGTATSVEIDPTKLVLTVDAAVETLTLDGSLSTTAGQVLTGIAGIAGGISPINHIIGGAGKDTISGGVNNDSLEGGAGNDSITGGAGQDNLLGGIGNDTLLGGDANDTLDGGVGNNSLDGGAGDDVLTGGDNTDTMMGGEGNDTLDGGGGFGDQIYGGAGDDVILFTATASPSVIDGGVGSDILRLAPGGGKIDFSALSVSSITGIETIEFASSGEVVFSAAQLTALPSVKGSDATGENLNIKTSNGFVLNAANFDNKIDIFTLDGTAGTIAQILTGIAGTAPVAPAADGTGGSAGYMPNNIITGGAGNDGITGGLSADTLTGGGGNDVLTSSDGNDSLLGGTGNDLLDSGVGNDTLDGGDGLDTLIGGDGTDVLTGGAGADKFSYLSATDATSLRKLSGSADAVAGASQTVAPSLSNIDTITDFVSNTDKIVLSAMTDISVSAGGLASADLQLFATGFVPLAANGNARFYFDMTNGVLFFDPSGNTAIDRTLGYTAGAADDFAVVKLTGVGTLLISDFTSS